MRIRERVTTHDLLDDLSGRFKVDETLVDLHLEVIPGLGTFTTGGLAGDDVKTLGGETDGSLDTEVLVLGSVDEISAN